MFIAIELVFALLAYIVITQFSIKKPASGILFVSGILMLLLVIGLALSKLWIILAYLPMLAALGVLIGTAFGVGVNLLRSWLTRPILKTAAWTVGLLLVIALSFHSTYRAAFEKAVACDGTGQPSQDVLTEFKGLDAQRFRVRHDPKFAWIRVRVDHQGSSFWGASHQPRNFTGEELKEASCDLTRDFSRPILLKSYNAAIRLDNQTNNLIEANVAQDNTAFDYIDIRFDAHNLGQQGGTDITMENGQTLQLNFLEGRTRVWNVSTKHHGLSMSFTLRGDAHTEPIEQAIYIIESFKGLDYLTPE